MTRAADFDVFSRPLQGLQLIEASAGTGKTWTLCGLVLRLLLERRLDISQVLVVTFTVAATAELRERIRARLAETLARLRGAPASADPFVDTLIARQRATVGLDDATMARRLDRALQHFDEAAIFTIHGFCQRALDELPFTAGAPLATTLVPDDRALRLEVVHDHWRRAVAGAALHPMLARSLADQGFAPAELDAALKLRLARPLARLRWDDGVEDPPPLDGDALQAAFDAARACWHTHGGAAVEAALGRPPKALNATSYKPARITEARHDWQAWLDGGDPLQAHDADSFKRLVLFTRAHVALRANKGVTVLPDHPFFDAAQALLDARDAALRAIRLHRQHLVWRLLRDGPDQLASLKAHRRQMGFDDLLGELHRRVDGAAHPGLARALRQRWPVALIDEFQDTDPLQWGIFRSIYRTGGGADEPPGALFLVGDPKQAIYGFRNADLPTYLAARSVADDTATLAQNQRSVQPLLDGLNALFGSHDRPFLDPAIGYPPVSAGARPRPALEDPGVDGGDAALALWALPGLLDADPDAALTRDAAGAAAFAACADEIVRLVDGGRAGRIRLGPRALRAGDIAVLVRTHRQAAVARAALAEAGIASVVASPRSVFASPEAVEAHRVLAAVREPAHEPRLRAALATEAMGWTADRIAALDHDEPALLAAIDRFSQAHAAWITRGIGPMLRRWMAAEGVAARLLAQPDGERRLTNWLHLADLLQAAAVEQRAPDALLRWLAGRIADPPENDETSQLRLESDRHLVQIVTVHRSKGLEYPIVFCPFAWQAAGAGPARPGPWTGHLDGEAVIDWRDPMPDDDAAASREATAHERLAEELRLLYVALTRAVHRCHVVVGAATSRKSTKADRRSALNWLVAGGAVGGWAAWSAGGKSADAQSPSIDHLRQAWRDLATRAGPAVSLRPLPPSTGARLAPEDLPVAQLQALPPPAAIPPRWTLGSYSLLAHGSSRETAVDHDEQVDAPAATATAGAAGDEAGDDPFPDLPDVTVDLDAHDGEAQADTAGPPPALAPDDILGFPRGATAGECLHAVYETADFTDPSGWPAAIAAALERFPPPAPHPRRVPVPPHDPPAALRRLLAESLATPLPLAGVSAPLRLATVPRTRRLAELAFHLPVGRLTAPALAGLLRRHGVPVPAGGFPPLAGYLRGYIDAVVEHEGRWHVIDWKSNHLGLRPADYARPRMEAAMREHAYHLQALIYAVAVHRLLRLRLAGYDPDRHLGEVLYLFVRGLRPGWRQADGRPCGAYAWQPGRALIEGFEALIDPAAASVPPTTGSPA